MRSCQDLLDDFPCNIRQAEIAALEAVGQAEMVDAEQMQQRLVGMRKMMGRPSEKTGTVTRQQYAEAQAKMEKMVESGEITAEQMRERLAAMRKLIGG